MSNEESWSTKCSKCGSIITIEASIKESLIKYQTVSELVEAEATVLDTDGEELDLVCDGCFRTIEWWDCDRYADPDLGHTGYDDDRGIETAYVKPNSWVKGQMHKSVEESADVEEKKEMEKEQGMSEDTSPQNLRKLIRNLFPPLEIDWDAAENNYEYSYQLASEIAAKSCKVAKKLGDIGDKRAVNPLIKLLNGKIENHIYSIVSEIDDEFNEDDMVFETITAAAEALGEIGDKEAVEPLINCLQSNDWWEFLDRREMDMWIEAIKALGDIGDGRALKPLNELLHNEEIMEIAMGMPFQWTLAEIRDPQSAYNNPNRKRSNPMRVAITEALNKLE